MNQPTQPAPPVAPPSPALPRVHRHIEEQFPVHLDRVRAFLRQPSVSAEDWGMRETAEMVKGMIEAIGGQAHLVETRRHPIVYGEVMRGKPKTLLIYGMYDVQPVNNQIWRVPPFEAIRTGVADPARDSVADKVFGFLRRSLAPLIAVTALGAVALVAFHNKETNPTDGPKVTRAKGLPNLNVIRFVDGHSVKTVSGDRFAPGDRVSFMVDLPEASQVHIVGIEASGSLYTAWPLDPNVATRLPAGAEQVLPGAVSLDSTVGRETLYLVVCPIGAPAPKCSVTPGTHALQCPPECKSAPFIMEKAQ